MTLCDLRTDANENIELLAEPEPLPTLGTVSAMTIYRHLIAERETNRRLRSRLRMLLSV